MLSVEQALRSVLASALPLPPRRVGLREALGRRLAEPVVSDIDSPPHDKAQVDGYAVIAGDVPAAGRELQVLEEITAGKCPTRAVELGTATRIMTGAPLPAGADAVVMVEDTEPLGGDRVRLLKGPPRPGQNIMRRAASLARGQTVLAVGKRLRAAEIGLLAEVGRPDVFVAGWPRVAIIATGDELVDAAQTPGPGQIRNSNGPLLMALALQAGADATALGIARDDPAALREKIAAALAHDVVLLSGGVSAGVLDLVPGALAALGVRPVFHKVNLKPGKPLWFGTRDREAGQPPTLVFGLPGNPVSTLVCFELFVRPAIERLSGLPGTGRPRCQAHLAREHRHRGERPTYWPARWAGGRGGEGAQVEPLAWQGSGDLRTLTEADCLAIFHGPDRVLAAGEVVEVLALDRDST